MRWLTGSTEAWTLIAKIPSSRTAQAVRLLDARCFDLREISNDLLRSIWESLIVVDHENYQITINKELDGSCPMTIPPPSSANSTKGKRQIFMRP
jgi:hypothetical protein